MFIVATVLVFVWETFWILSVTAELDAVVRSSPAAKTVRVEYVLVSTDHTTEEIVAEPRNLDQSIL
jgi:hypothetical protein